VKHDNTAACEQGNVEQVYINKCILTREC
jgi:hypothetical protein